MMDETLAITDLSKMFVQASWYFFFKAGISLFPTLLQTHHPVTSILLGQWISLKGFASRCARTNGSAESELVGEDLSVKVCKHWGSLDNASWPPFLDLHTAPKS